MLPAEQTEPRIKLTDAETNEFISTPLEESISTALSLK